MAVDVSGARAAYQQTLFGDWCYIVRPRVVDDGGGSTMPHPDGPVRIGPLACKFGVNKVWNAETQGDRLQQRGSYTVKLAIGQAVLITDEIELVARPPDEDEQLLGRYQVVWTPPPSALSLRRVVGLEEATDSP
ncbi:MAG TPA: hypothetical protein VFS21_29845 [Roseiflexaceae bacterium]|nr:hypothetical protein [Roseiflexaceae bacterium]